MDSIVPGLEFGTARSAVDWNFTTTPQKGLNGRSFNYQMDTCLVGVAPSVSGKAYAYPSIH